MHNLINYTLPLYSVGILNQMHDDSTGKLIIIRHNARKIEWMILMLMTLIPEYHKVYRTYSMN